MNLPKSENSKGVVLFGFNTAEINYVEIAKRTAILIKKYLQLPVTLITDCPSDSDVFDHEIYVENNFYNIRALGQTGSVWRNGNRYLAYQYSPYQKTILIDTDYLVLTDNLLKCVDQVTDYAILDNNKFLCSDLIETMGPLSFKTIYATAIIFKKTSKTELLFQLVGRIQRNYEYYRNLYRIQMQNFRNDFAFTMANNILNGYQTNNQNLLPFTLTTIDTKIQNIELRDNFLLVRTQDKGYVFPKNDLHIIDKQYLLSIQHQNFLNQIL